LFKFILNSIKYIKNNILADSINGVLFIKNHNIVCLIFEHKEDKIVILGYKKIKSSGIKDGIITDFNLAHQTFASVINEAEFEAKIRIHKVIIYLETSHSKHFIYPFSTHVHNTISQEVLQNLLEIKTIESLLEKNQYVCNILPINVIIDDNKVENPIGLYANKINLDIFVSTIDETIILNYKKILDYLDIKIKGFISSPILLTNNIESRDTTNEGAIELILYISKDITTYCYKENNIIKKISIINIGDKYISSYLSKKLNITEDVIDEIRTDYLSQENIKNNYSNKNIEIEHNGVVKVIKYKNFYDNYNEVSIDLISQLISLVNLPKNINRLEILSDNFDFSDVLNIAKGVFDIDIKTSYNYKVVIYNNKRIALDDFIISNFFHYFIYLLKQDIAGSTFEARLKNYINTRE
jgi:cell division protein FtsA